MADRLGEVDFEKLSQEGKVDYLLLQNRLGHDLSLLGREEARFREMQALLPFAAAIMDLHERQRRMETVAGERPRAPWRGWPTRPSRRPALDSAAARPTRIVAYRAAAEVLRLRETLKRWYDFYAGYDPLFTWWSKAPYEKTSAALQQYAKALREKVVGVKEGEDEPIVGDPIGRAALVEDLAYEMIPYTPEELIKVAEREFAWCEAEMLKASRAMGFGDDWRAAMEKVKALHVEPGKQTDLVRDLARDAVTFIEQRGLVTVPPLAKDDWWIEMLSPPNRRPRSRYPCRPSCAATAAPGSCGGQPDPWAPCAQMRYLFAASNFPSFGILGERSRRRAAVRSTDTLCRRERGGGGGGATLWDYPLPGNAFAISGAWLHRPRLSGRNTLSRRYRR